MSELPNPDDFEKYQKAGFQGTIRVVAELVLFSNATTEVEARADFERQCDEYDLCDAGFIEEADIRFVRRRPVMYAVMRNGQEMGVSSLQAGDTPRLLNKYEQPDRLK